MLEKSCILSGAVRYHGHSVISLTHSLDLFLQRGATTDETTQSRSAVFLHKVHVLWAQTSESLGFDHSRGILQAIFNWHFVLVEKDSRIEIWEPSESSVFHLFLVHLSPCSLEMASEENGSSGVIGDLFQARVHALGRNFTGISQTESVLQWCV